MIPKQIRHNFKIMNQSVMTAGYNGIERWITNLRFQRFATCDGGNRDGKCQDGKCKEINQTEGKCVVPWPRPDHDPCAQMWRWSCPHEAAPPNNDPYRIKTPDIVVPPLPPVNAKAAIDCAKQKSVCSVPAPPPPPVCPPPPPKPFPWLYVWSVALFMSLCSLVYQLYLIYDEYTKNAGLTPIWRPRRKRRSPHYFQDLPPCVPYLIIGAGAAAWSAYLSIMKHDKKAKVFFITVEDMLPYMRPPMSKTMWWNREPPDIANLNYRTYDIRQFSMFYAPPGPGVVQVHPKFMHPVKFYRKKTGPAVSVATGWCVDRIEPEDHRIWIKTVCGEVPMYYERCLLATGSKPKTMRVFESATKPVRGRLTYFRTIRDLELAYRRVKEAKHITIIGGGCLGTELAWHIGKMNTVVEREPEKPPVAITHLIKDKGVLAGLIPDYLGEWTNDIIRKTGVTLVNNVQVYDAFESPDGRTELTLSNGNSLVTDFVIVAIGTEPCVELGRSSHLEIDPNNGGVVANTELQVRKHVYAAGDCASFYSQWKDYRLRFEHYINAYEQGQIAGANMVGHWIPCNLEPHFWFRLGRELEVEVIGEAAACLPTIGIFKDCAKANQEGKEPCPEDGTPTVTQEEGCYKKEDEYKYRYKHGIVFYLRDETIVGIVFWNIPPVADRTLAVIEMLRARPSYKLINLIVELMGFPDAECVFERPPKKGLCD